MKEEEELELDNNEDTKTEDDDDENKEEDTKTEDDDDERDEDKERFLKMFLENSNSKFKHELAYQDKMYKLYLEKKVGVDLIICLYLNNLLLNM